MATPARTRTPKNKGIFGWIERHILDLQDNPERAARVLRNAYWVSVAFLLFGYAVMLTTLFFSGSPAAPYWALGLVLALLFWASYAFATRKASPKGPR